MTDNLVRQIKQRFPFVDAAEDRNSAEIAGIVQRNAAVIEQVIIITQIHTALFQ